MIPLYDDIKKDSFGFLIWIILIINIIVSFIIFRLPIEKAQYIVENFSITSISGSNPFSFLLKSLFSLNIHGDFWHLLTNMLFLVAFGLSLENRIGKLWFSVLYFGAGISGCLWYSLLQSKLPLVGASGAISGLMATYLILFPKARLLSFWLILWIVRFLYIPAWFYVGVWIILQIILSIFDKGSYVAYEAHLGGILFGSVFGIIAKKLFIKGKETK